MDQPKFEAYQEEIRNQYKAIHEFVRDIPAIKEDVAVLKTDVAELKQDMRLAKDVVRQHSSGIAELKAHSHHH